LTKCKCKCKTKKTKAKGKKYTFIFWRNFYEGSDGDFPIPLSPPPRLPFGHASNSVPVCLYALPRQDARYALYFFSLVSSTCFIFSLALWLANAFILPYCMGLYCPSCLPFPLLSLCGSLWLACLLACGGGYMLKIFV